MNDRPPEIVVAEKLHSMVTLGIVDTPLEDYYTVWRLATENEFDRATLTAAVREEFERRDTEVPADTPEALVLGYADYWDKAWQPLAVRLEVGRDAPPLAKVLEVLRSFLSPVIEAAAGGAEPDADWTPDSGWTLR
jgi:hypothetical protein